MGRGALARSAGGLLAASWLLACGTPPDPAPEAAAGALVGAEPVPSVHLYENHSSALMAWRQAGVAGRILVHLDGHIDFDWLPDATVARIAAARPEELPYLELHPYAMDDQAYSRFGIWNFVYPAARLGMVRELVWVVPDGTLRDRTSALQLVVHRLFGQLQGISLPEAAGLRREGRVLRGALLGLPVTVCEIADLPDLGEPVLLDIDLDYFTTRSAVTQGVTAVPWTGPDAVLAALRDRGLRTDLATVSLSTIGGFLPPTCRWLGQVVRDRLRSPGQAVAVPEELIEARSLEAAAPDPARSVEICRRWTERSATDATAWFLLYRALRSAGREEEAARAREEAVRLDPLLEHEDLFEADRLWMNGEYEAALAHYRGYASRLPDSPFQPYARRRKASCLMHLGRESEAVATLWEVLEAAPRHADTHLDLGILLRKRGRIAEALEELRIARRILPDRADYAMALGTTYLMAGRTEEGIDHLQDAVRRRPCWQDARAHLAMALIRVGRYEEAGPHLDAGLAIPSPNPRLRQIAAELRRRGVEPRPLESISFE